MDYLTLENLTRSNIFFEIRRDGEFISQINLQAGAEALYRPPNIGAGFIPPQDYQIDVRLPAANGINPGNSVTSVRIGDISNVLLSVDQTPAGGYSVIAGRTPGSIGATDPNSVAPCYVTGTYILTNRGEVTVEDVAIGDVVVTSSGEHRPIRWIGSRAYPGLSAPQAECPVRIRAGTLIDGVPARDLLVSPDHALMVDGLFVAAGHLVNGTSITRGEAIRNLTYWHVELDSHDLLMAENTPAESFLPAPGVRAGFDGVQALDAGAATKSYAPRTELGPELATLRGRLARRAVSSGDAADLGPVRAWLDRCAVSGDGTLHVAGWAQDTAQPDAPVCLDVTVDGAVVAFTVASEYRADLAAVGWERAGSASTSG